MTAFADAMWREASQDAAAEAAERRLAVARVRAAEVWPFLAASRSIAEYSQRERLVLDRLAAAADSVSPADPLLLEEVRSSLAEDWRAVRSAPAPAADQALAARAALALRWRRTRVARLRVSAGLHQAAPLDLTPRHRRLEPDDDVDPGEELRQTESALAAIQAGSTPPGWAAQAVSQLRAGLRHTAPGGGEHAPYRIEQIDGRWYVVNDRGEKKEDTGYATKEEARQHQEALYANVPGASESAAEDERRKSAARIAGSEPDPDERDRTAGDDHLVQTGYQHGQDDAERGVGPGRYESRDPVYLEAHDRGYRDAIQELERRAGSRRTGRGPHAVRGRTAELDGSYWVIEDGGRQVGQRYTSKELADTALSGLRDSVKAAPLEVGLAPDPGKLRVVKRPPMDAAATRQVMVACGKCQTGHTPDGAQCQYCDGVGALSHTAALIKEADGWGQGLLRGAAGPPVGGRAAVYHPEEYGSARYEDVPSPPDPRWVNDEWDPTGTPWTPGPPQVENGADGTELRQRDYLGATNPYDPAANPYRVTPQAPDEAEREPGPLPDLTVPAAATDPARPRVPRAQAAREARVTYGGQLGPLGRMAAEAMAVNPGLSPAQAWALAGEALRRYPQAAGSR